MIHQAFESLEEDIVQETRGVKTSLHLSQTRYDFQASTSHQFAFVPDIQVEEELLDREFNLCIALIDCSILRFLSFAFFKNSF